MKEIGKGGLVQSLRFFDILLLAFSTMIGWGWVSLTGTWVVQGGVLGATLAFALGAALCVFVGLTYCELTPMFPYAGGEWVFAYQAMGYEASWLTGWMTAFAYLGITAWEGPALASAIDCLFPIPRHGYLYSVAGFDVYLTWLLVPVAAGAALIFINIQGIHLSAYFQSAVTGILALGGVLFILVGVFRGDAGNVQPLFTSPSGFLTVSLAVPAMFVGFDVIPQIVEEMNAPIRKAPMAIILSICMAAAWYIAMIVSAALSAPASVLSRDGLTVINAIDYATGNPVIGKALIVTALMGILSSWNGFIIGVSRTLYSMGQAGMLPAAFGKVHPQYRTPAFSTLAVGILSILASLLGKNSLSWFVSASGFGAVIVYFMVALSFLLLRIKRPDAPRPFRIWRGTLVGTAAVLISALFIVSYLPIGNISLGAVEWAIVFAWLAVGAVLYLISVWRKRRDSNE